MTPPPRPTSLARAVLLAGAVAACGGGGPRPASAPDADPAPRPAAPSDAPASAPPFDPARDVFAGLAYRDAAPDLEPADFEDAAYAASVAGAIGASEAYARGARGQGTVIGVIDDGFGAAGGLFGRRLRVAAVSPAARAAGAEGDHGAWVASVAAGGRGVIDGFQGVAYETEVLGYAAPTATGSIDPEAAARALDDAAARGLDVVNMSFADLGAAGETLDLPGRLSRAMAQAAAAGVVLVVSTGNDGRGQPSLLSALPLYADGAFGGEAWYAALGENPMAGRALAVTALAADGRSLAGFANACGLARDFCLAAPGTAVRAVDADGAVARVSGTSFSAPAVAGAYAVLRSMWPDLPERDLVEILLRTADDIGAPGVDGVFGYGRLNLARAVSPVGDVVLPAPGPLARLDPADGHLVTASTLVASAALGPAIRRLAAEGPALAVFDRYGRGFRVDMAGFASAVRRRFDLRGALAEGGRRRDLVFDLAPGLVARLAADPAGRADMAAPAIRLRQGAMTVSLAKDGRPSDIAGVAAFDAVSAPTGYIDARRLAHPFIGLLETPDSLAAQRAVGPDAAIGVFYALGETETGRDGVALGVTGRRDLGAESHVALTVGVARERGGMLGAAGTRAFAFGDADTAFASVGARAGLGGGVALVADAHLGLTRMGAGGAVVRGGEALSSAWTVGVEAAGALRAGDRLGVAIGQPLTVETGALRLRLPTARGAADHEAPLAGARPIDLRIGWTTPLGRADSLALGGAIRFGEGGDASEIGVIAGLRYRRDF